MHPSLFKVRGLGFKGWDFRVRVRLRGLSPNQVAIRVRDKKKMRNPTPTALLA